MGLITEETAGAIHPMDLPSSNAAGRILMDIGLIVHLHGDEDRLIMVDNRIARPIGHINHRT